MEQKHHQITHEDTFLCIPPLYHTGAKFHWMGSLFAGSKAVLLKGTSPEIILKAVSDEQCTVVWSAGALGPGYFGCPGPRGCEALRL